ncbi:hypothetical protein ACP70R_008344 [Stipagrostis hirtigluma subsp. patula]
MDRLREDDVLAGVLGLLPPRSLGVCREWRAAIDGRSFLLPRALLGIFISYNEHRQSGTPNCSRGHSRRR